VVLSARLIELISLLAIVKVLRVIKSLIFVLLGG